MKRIITSQLYQLRRNTMLLRISLLVAVSMAAMGALVSLTSDGDRSAGGLFTDSNGLMWIFQIMLIGVMTGIICAGDFGEKDINYELMNGHSRRSIYLARVILCVGLASVVAEILAFIPCISAAAVSGWGDRIKPGDLFARMGLFIFPFMRMAAFFSMLSFMIKKQGIVMILGFAAEMGCIILNDIVQDKSGYMLSVFNIIKLTDVGDFGLYNVVPGKGVVEYFVCEGALEPSLAAGTVIVSLVMTLIYLTAGYAFFRKDDLE